MYRKRSEGNKKRGGKFRNEKEKTKSVFTFQRHIGKKRSTGRKGKKGYPFKGDFIIPSDTATPMAKSIERMRLWVRESVRSQNSVVERFRSGGDT